MPNAICRAHRKMQTSPEAAPLCSLFVGLVSGKTNGITDEFPGKLFTIQLATENTISIPVCAGKINIYTDGRVGVGLRGGEWFFLLVWSAKKNWPRLAYGKAAECCCNEFTLPRNKSDELPMWSCFFVYNKWQPLAFIKRPNFFLLRRTYDCVIQNWYIKAYSRNVIYGHSWKIL